MPKQVKVVNVNDETTYADIAETIHETEQIEVEPVEEPKTEELGEPEPPKPKARAKRTPKPKALARTDTAVDVEVEVPPEIVEVKPKAKRVAKVKQVEPPVVVEPPDVVEPPPEKSKAIRKPRVKKEESPNVQPTMPVRMSRAAKREELYHSLASNALP